MASSYQSRHFRSTLPSKGMGSNTIGYDIAMKSAIKQGGRPSSFNLSGASNLGSMQPRNPLGVLNRSESASSGVELYYGSNRRVGTPHHSKRGALRRGLATNQLSAIQNTQKALIAGLGVTSGGGSLNSSTTDLPQSSHAVRLANHLKALKDSKMQGTGNESRVDNYQHQQQPGGAVKERNVQQYQKQPLTPASTAAAAAAAVVAQQKKGTSEGSKRMAVAVPLEVGIENYDNAPKKDRVRKSVRWANVLHNSEMPAPGFNQPKHKGGSLTVNSILAVGGDDNYSSRYVTGHSKDNDAAKGGMGKREATLRASDSAAAVVVPNSFSSTIAANEGVLRPHTSGSLESSIIAGKTQTTAAHRYTPLLEMRRQQGQRPSLSEQLAAITADADALTKDIRAKGGLDRNDDPNDQPIVVLPAKSFSVGTLCCRYPSPTRYYRDRIEYTFHHPYEHCEVHMIMHYSDMMQTALTAGRLKFKLPRRLVHFASDFDPNNPTHVIAIELGTTAATSIVREKVLPLVHSHGSAGLGLTPPRRGY